MADKISEFEERKKQLIKKKRCNRVKRRFVVFVFLLVCTGIIFTVLKAPFFDVKTIVCVGQENLSEEDIIKISGAKTDVNIFSTSIKGMKRRLVEDPGIDECNVRRLYPNKIKIWVRESKAYAMAQSNGLLLFVDKKGQIIKIEDEAKAQEIDEVKTIAKLEEFEPASTKLGEYIVDYAKPVHQKTFECIEILDKLEMLDKVKMISAVDLSDIKVDYDNRLYIMLGDYEKMEYKLTFIKKVISQNLSEYEKAILDYRGEKLYVGPASVEEEKLPKEEILEDEKTEETSDNSQEETQNKEN